MSKPPKPVLKGSVYYLTRRVPARYASIDSRRFVDCSLHTDSLSAATAKAVEIWDHHIAAWEAKLAGNTDDAEARFAAARELADLRGFRYMSAKQVSELPYDDIMKRLAAGLGSEPDKIDKREAAAILGTAQEPPITVSRSLDLYWTLTKDQTLTKSADQLRRWRNPRLKAIKNFIAVVGDKPLRDISGDDMLNFPRMVDGPNYRRRPDNQKREQRPDPLRRRSQNRHSIEALELGPSAHRPEP